VAGENVACLGRSGDSLGGVDERVAELTAQLVPRFDSLARFGEELAGVDR
jgi:hypothetical protein